MISGIKKYKMELKVITPVFIGGDAESNIDKSSYIYYPKKRLVIVIDQGKLASFLYERKLTDSYLKFVEQINKNSRGQNNNPNANNLDVYRWLKARFPGEIDKIIERITKYKLQVGEVQKEKLNDIQCFIRTKGEPYIPGSSIKGAIRTAVLSEYIGRHRIKPPVSQKEARRYADRIEDCITKTTEKDGKDVLFSGFAGISISDSDFIDESRFELLQTTDLNINKPDATPKRLPLYREYLKPGTKINFTLTLDLEKLKWGKATENIEDFYGIKKSLDYFLKEQLIKDIWEEKVHPSIMHPKATGLFFLGGGCGYNTKTFTAAVYKDKNERLDFIRKLLTSKKEIEKKRNGKKIDLKYYHLDDNPFSPRTIKIQGLKAGERITGLCQIRVLEEC